MSRVEDLIAEHCPNGVEFRRLGDLVRIKNGKDHKQLGDGDIPVYGSGGVMRYADTFAYDKPSVLIPRKGSLGNLFYVNEPFWTVDTIFYTQIDETQVLPKFLYYFLSTVGLGEMNQAGGVPSQTQSVLNELKIPVPPTPVQREIAGILDEFGALKAELQGVLEAELDRRALQYATYRQQVLDSVSSAPSVQIRDVVDFFNARAHEKLVDPSGTVALMTARFVSRGEADRFVRPEDVLSPAYEGDVALVMSDLPNGRALARTFCVDEDGKYAANQRVCLLRSRDRDHLLPGFLCHVMDRNPQLLAYNNGSDQTHLKKDYILEVRIPVPSVQEQKRVVATLERLDGLFKDLVTEIGSEITARRKQFQHYRDHLLTFEEGVA